MVGIKKKLKSDRGASLVAALLLFLLCAVIGAVIMTAASANLDRTFLRQEEQRDYLSVRSAAWLIRDKAENSNFNIITETVVTYEDGARAGTSVDGPNFKWEDEEENELNDLLKRLAQQVFESKHEQKKTLTITGEGMSDVSAELTLAPEGHEDAWKLTAVVRPKEHDSRSVMTLTVNAEIVESKESSWRTSERVDEEGNVTVIRKERTVELTDIKWTLGEIEKGAE